MPSVVDEMMENASQKLAQLDYPAAETLCLEALGLARDAANWHAYARVLLPLQECRRQRRVNAAETAVQLGTGACWQDPRGGCIAVTRPQDAHAAARRLHDARHGGQATEVLWCDHPTDAAAWRVASPLDPALACDVPPPDPAWVNRRLTPADGPAFAAAGHWFIAASEALGDAALQTVSAPPGSRARLDELEKKLAAAGDHEILHQRLADVARALAAAGVPA